MADVTASKHSVIKLSLLLNDKEKNILKGWMQNPVNTHYPDPNDEPEDERKLRFAIFNSLHID